MGLVTIFGYEVSMYSLCFHFQLRTVVRAELRLSTTRD